jgi:WD40 repeat protein
MAPRSGSRSLRTLVVLTAIIVAACAVVVALWLARSPMDCGDYAPAERVLNCFGKDKLGEPLAVSPEGKQLVCAGYRMLTWVADWDDRNRCSVVTHDIDFGEGVESAAFSGDGRLVVFFVRSPAQDVVAVFDARRRELLTKWPAPRSIYRPLLRLSHDGALLALSSTELVNRSAQLEAVTVWDTSAGKLVGALRTPATSYLADFVFIRGELLLAYYGRPEYQEIRVCRSAAPYAKAAPVTSIKATGVASFCGARLSADGARLAIASHHAQPLRVYAVPDGHLIAEFDKPFYGVTTDIFPGFSFSPSGKFLAVSNSGGTAGLWHIDSAKELCTLEGRRYDVMHQLLFGPDDAALISIDYGAVVVWQVGDLVGQER